MAGVDDEAILRARFLNGVSASKGDAPFRRLTKRFHQFANACSSTAGGPTAAGERARELHRGLMREIGVCELQLGVWDLKSRKLDPESTSQDFDMLQLVGGELRGYDSIKTALMEEGERVQEEVTTKKRKLEEAKLERRQFEEWKELKATVDR